VKGVPAAALKWILFRSFVARSASFFSVCATVWPSTFSSTLVTPPLWPAGWRALASFLWQADWASRWRIFFSIFLVAVSSAKAAALIWSSKNDLRDSFAFPLHWQRLLRAALSATLASIRFESNGVVSHLRKAPICCRIGVTVALVASPPTSVFQNFAVRLAAVRLLTRRIQVFSGLGPRRAAFLE
jgi:hypothetical protein